MFGSRGKESAGSSVTPEGLILHELGNIRGAVEGVRAEVGNVRAELASVSSDLKAVRAEQTRQDDRLTRAESAISTLKDVTHRVEQVERKVEQTSSGVGVLQEWHTIERHKWSAPQKVIVAVSSMSGLISVMGALLVVARFILATPP
jgi:chromosome segregation ATPase